MSGLPRCIAIVDVNNFFVSCERVFRPDLHNKPVIVASSNDGNVVARSNESKALGVKMGVPIFKIRELIREHQINVFSGNMPLYASMSNRVMNILSEYFPIQEIYSIDESFGDLTGLADVPARCREMKDRISRDTTLPVSIGTAPTKVLAKLCNFMSKRHPRSRGTFHYHLLSETQIRSILTNLPVEEVWGIGARLTSALNAGGIHSALQLRDADIPSMRQRFGVVLEKTIRELRGECCLELEDVAPAKQQIMTSRSFGQTVTSVEDLQIALAHFVSASAKKLRDQRSVCSMLQVFLMTDRFRQDQAQYCPSISLPLTTPSANNLTLHKYAVLGLHRIFKEGYAYKKAGVLLSEIGEEGAWQGDLFSPIPEDPALMHALDAMNRRYGKGTLKLSEDGARHTWHARQRNKSPAYTSDWNELPLCS